MTDKIKKNKCEMLIKQIFGSNFYFIHGTRCDNIEPILKSEYINISCEIDKKYWRWYETDNNGEPLDGLKYIYCWMKHVVI